MERELSIERTRAGLDVARQLCRKGRRKRQMTESKIKSARRLLASGVPPRDLREPPSIRSDTLSIDSSFNQLLACFSTPISNPLPRLTTDQQNQAVSKCAAPTQIIMAAFKLLEVDFVTFREQDVT